MRMISRAPVAILSASMVVAVAAGGCSGGSTGSLDGGTEASAPLGDAGGGPDGAADGGSSSADGSAGLDFCMRQTDLDTDCATAFGTTAPHGYSCSDVFMHAPPCQALSSRGCTEICSNRCCP